MALIFSLGIVWMVATYFQPLFNFRFDPIGRYVDWSISHLLSKIQNETYRKSVILLLPVLLLSVIFFDFKIKHFFILSFFLNTFILWFAWNYRERTEIIAGSIKAREEEILCDPLTGPFTVVFWFFISGPMGVIFYDLVRRLRFFPLNTLMEWPASRVLGFGYALAGHFSPVFNYWSRYFFSNLLNSTDFVKNCGLHALYAENESPCDSEEKLEYALALVRRAKIMLLLIVLIFSIGVWL